MVYRKRYRKVQHVSEAVLKAAIVALLRKFPKKEEALTPLIGAIRDDGLHIPTRPAEAEHTLERMGFFLRRERNSYGSILRTYVQLGDDDGEEGSSKEDREEDVGLDREEDSREG